MGYINVEQVHPWYRARLRYLLDWAMEITEGSNGIELGSGTGYAASKLMEKTQSSLLVTESNDEAIEFLVASRMTSLRLDATNPKHWPNSMFDFAVAMDVFEHIEDDKKAAKLLYQHLKPGARLFVTVPSFMFLWSRHDEDNEHFRRYTKGSIIELFTSAGFSIETIRYWNSTLLIPIFLRRNVHRILGRKEWRGDSYKLPGPFVAWFVSQVYKLEERFSSFFGRVPGCSIIVTARK